MAETIIAITAVLALIGAGAAATIALWWHNTPAIHGVIQNDSVVNLNEEACTIYIKNAFVRVPICLGAVTDFGNTFAIMRIP